MNSHTKQDFATEKSLKFPLLFHLDHCILCMVVRWVEDQSTMTDDLPGEDRDWFGGEDDNHIWEGRDEGEDPDESNERVGPLQSADVDMMKRSADCNVTLDCHSSQIQRGVPGWNTVIKRHIILFVQLLPQYYYSSMAFNMNILVQRFTACQIM